MLYFERVQPTMSGGIVPTRHASVGRTSSHQAPRRQQTTEGGFVDAMLSSLRSSSAGRGD